jgi:hypothetical protein
VADDGQSRADAGALSAGYEQLRSAVLSGGAGGWRLGHGVLATRGTVAWIAAVGEVAPGPQPAVAAAASEPATSTSTSTSTAASLPGAGEIVAVLAQMTLAIAA